MNSDMCLAPESDFNNETDGPAEILVHVEPLSTGLCFPAYCAYSHFWWVLGYLQFETEETEICKAYNELWILFSMK